MGESEVIRYCGGLIKITSTALVPWYPQGAMVQRSSVTSRTKVLRNSLKKTSVVGPYNGRRCVCFGPREGRLKDDGVWTTILGRIETSVLIGPFEVAEAQHLLAGEFVRLNN